MNIIVFAAAAVIAITPTDPPAVAHEQTNTPFLELAAQPDPPKSIWRQESSGDGVHAQSTLVCPAKVAGFDRSLLAPFDNFGFDVGCNFDRAGARVTLYLTRRTNRTLQDDLTAAQSAMKQNMTDVQPITGATAMPGTLGALYARTDGTRTGVWVADVFGWTLKFRATFAVDRESDVLSAMSGLTARANDTAGKHLGACAAAPPVTRSGATITDKEQNDSLAMMAGILSATADAGEKSAGAATQQWCAEEAAGDQEIPLLFWRNIKAAADGGPADRISLMTVGEPPMLISSGNPLLSEIEKDSGGPIYELDAYQGTTAFVFAFFKGRPAAATLSPIAKDIFLGKRNPLVSYDTKSNTITISKATGKAGTRPLNLKVREDELKTPYRDFSTKP